MEKEPYCREVLLRRQRDGVLDLFPTWDEVRTFEGLAWRGVVDIVTAGFPCQPWSHAGRADGRGDPRNLWPHTIRIIREVGPRYVLLENVPAFLAHQYFGTVLQDLAQSGLDCCWDCIPAAAVGAPHRRDRLWILGYAHGHGESTFAVDGEASELPEVVADTIGSRLEVGKQGREAEPSAVERGSWWESEPGVGRVAHGVAHRVDRLKAIGNGQVPDVVRRACLTLEEEAE